MAELLGDAGIPMFATMSGTQIKEWIDKLPGFDGKGVGQIVFDAGLATPVGLTLLTVEMLTEALMVEFFQAVQLPPLIQAAIEAAATPSVNTNAETSNNTQGNVSTKSAVAMFQDALFTTRDEFHNATLEAQNRNDMLHAQLKEAQDALSAAKQEHMLELQKKDRETETAKAILAAQMDSAKGVALKSSHQENFKIQVELIKSLKLLVEADKTKDALQTELDRTHRNVSWGVAVRRTSQIITRRAEGLLHSSCIAWRLNLKESMHKRLLTAHAKLLAAKVAEAAKHSTALKKAEAEAQDARKVVERIRSESERQSIVDSEEAKLARAEELKAGIEQEIRANNEVEAEKMAQALQMFTDEAELTLAEVVLLRSETTEKLQDAEVIEAGSYLRTKTQHSLRWALGIMERKVEDVEETGEHLKSWQARAVDAEAVRTRTRLELRAWKDELTAVEKMTVQKSALSMMRSFYTRRFDALLYKLCMVWCTNVKGEQWTKALQLAKLREVARLKEDAISGTPLVVDTRPPEPTWAPPNWDNAEFMQPPGYSEGFSQGEMSLKLSTEPPEENWLTALLR